LGVYAAGLSDDPFIFHPFFKGIMDWVIVNYYRTGETFTVIESEVLEYRKYHKIKAQLKFFLPLVLGFVQLLK
jgi:hypothetical protein